MQPLTDTILAELMRERLRLQRELAPILTRAGGNHPKRQLFNRKRAVVRKQLRRAVKQNGEAIIAHLMSTYGETIGQ